MTKLSIKLISEKDIMYDFAILLTIAVMAFFIGYFVIKGVIPPLYSPLMSLANAISGIVIIGAITFHSGGWWDFAAVFLAAINIFGGFAITARMLSMFNRKKRIK